MPKRSGRSGDRSHPRRPQPSSLSRIGDFLRQLTQPPKEQVVDAPPEFPQTGTIKVLNLHGLAANVSRTSIIFIHYHPRECFAPGFVKLIESACASGYRVIVASNARPSKASAVLKMGDLVYVHRANIGYDFGALRDVRTCLSNHGLLDQERYVIINSSMLNIASAGFGSDPVLDRLAAHQNDVDLLGVTSSYEKAGYHIQSYFYSLSGTLFGSSKLAEWLDAYWQGLGSSKLTPRNYAIQKGELRFTSWACRNGFTASSVFDHLHFPTSDFYQQVNHIADKLASLLGSELNFVPHPARPEGPSILATFRSECLPRLGSQYNPSQAWWALFLINNFLFLKRELLENSFLRGNTALAVQLLIYPVLEVTEVSLPAWSDLFSLPNLIHASRPSQGKTSLTKSKSKSKSSSQRAKDVIDHESFI